MALTALAAIPATAKEPLITDRPDFTESAFVVGRGVVQLEGGATWAETDDETVATAPELLVRWGLTRKLELRLLTPTYAWIDADGSSSGFLDTAIGAKLALNDGQGDGLWGRTGAGLIVATTVPTGSSAVSSDVWQPAVSLALAWDLGPSVSLGSNLGWTRPEDDGRRFDTLYASAAVGIGITGATSMFVELIWFDRERDRGPDTSTFQAGLTHLVSDDLQLDLRAARRLSSEGADLLVGLGASVRF